MPTTDAMSQAVQYIINSTEETYETCADYINTNIGDDEINDLDETGQSLAMYAATYGKVSILRYLHIERSADLTECDISGRNLAILAALNGHLDIIIYLHEQNIRVASYTVDVDADDEEEEDNELDNSEAESNSDSEEDSSTMIIMIPLLYAAESGHLDIVSSLVETCGCGEDINYPDHDDNTAVTVAAEKGHLNVLRYLLTHGATTSLEHLLILAVENNHLHIVEYLIGEQSADLNSVDNEENTAATVAAAQGHLDVLRYLLTHGATTSLEHLLILAVVNNHLNIVEYLIGEQHVAVDTCDEKETTILMMAATEGFTDIALYLIGHGADRSLTNLSGNTALDYARDNHNFTLITLLGEPIPDNAPHPYDGLEVIGASDEDSDTDMD